MPLDDDDDAVPLRDEANQWNYTFFRDIRSVVAACGAPSFGEGHDVLVVRPEYRLLLAHLTNLSSIRGVAVTGKSLFLIFLLLHRLQNRLPTAIQLVDDVVCFNDKGVAIHDPKEKIDLVGYWALSDSNSVNTTPSSTFIYSSAFVIQATSRKRDRWKEWLKEVSGTVIMSEPPHVLEIGAVLKELKLEYQYAKHYVEKWGPCTRTIIQIFKRSPGARGAHEESLFLDVELAAQDVCVNPTAYRTVDSRGSAQSVGSVILFTRPYRRQHKLSAEAMSYVPTSFLSNILNAYSKGVSNAKALDLFEILSTHSLTRPAAGWILETRVHRALCTEDGRERLNIRRTVPPTESTVGPADITVLATDIERTIQPSQTLLRGTVKVLRDVVDLRSFYWVPSAANFPGVDGVLADRDTESIYAIQTTTAEDHTSPADGLKKVWENFDTNVQTRCAWHLVVVADTKKLASKHEANFAREGITLGQSKIPVLVWSCVYR
ncbi:hypothetical protein EUX98_g8795 [Antrodiella citrinella]|uniref:Uncharacterized protein n=1 Tax=Antrodiella citrinella TaxID=2447956 RepID=A0A4S4M2S0_9APHY|nr:hypothetical protein EUX98_g8795 [Antrodiella citrinella]